MKIKISLASLLLVFCALSFAQEYLMYSEDTGRDLVYEPSSIWNDWFIQIGLGGQAFVGENFKSANFMKELSLMPAFAVGKWWSPYWGNRLQGQGGTLHTFPTGKTSYKQMDSYSNIHIDALCNVSQYFDPYNYDRAFSLIPYAGLGIAWRGEADDNPPPRLSSHLGYHTESVSVATVHGGLLLQLRLSDAIGVHADIAGTLLTNDKLNRWVGGLRYEGIFSFSVGLTIHLDGLFD